MPVAFHSSFEVKHDILASNTINILERAIKDTLQSSNKNDIPQDK